MKYMIGNKISISVKFPMPVNESNGIGVMYSEKAIIDACENAVNTPIVEINNSGEEIVVGVVNEAVYEDEYIRINGTCWYGDAREKIEFDNNKQVTVVKLTGLGLV